MEYIPWVAAIVIYIVLFSLFGRSHCKHELIMCLHGDEINMRGGDRSVCIVCDTSFPALPEVCTYTNRKHYHPADN